jgi:cytosine deaminase
MVVANPAINILIQGRHDSYPKRRGLTRVPELRAAGLTVAFGSDCMMDPWYPLGMADMLDIAFIGLHVGQMQSPAGIRACFDAVTVDAARVMGLDGYGLAPGCRADMVLLDARDPVEAVRTRAARLAVIRSGAVLAESPARVATLHGPAGPEAVSLTLR